MTESQKDRVTEGQGISIIAPTFLLSFDMGTNYQGSNVRLDTLNTEHRI